MQTRAYAVDRADGGNTNSRKYVLATFSSLPLRTDNTINIRTWLKTCPLENILLACGDLH